MLMPGRHYNADKYRFGFQGQEKDDEIKGAGNSYDFGARIYDPRVGRWLACDPLANKYPFASTYNFALNTPIQAYDPDGRLVIFAHGYLLDQDFYEQVLEHPYLTKKRENMKEQIWGLDYNMYWSGEDSEGNWVDIDVAFMERIGDDNVVYASGHNKNSSQGFDRWYEGVQAAEELHQKIQKGEIVLEKNEDGDIIKSIKIVGHSQGGAYAAGMADRLKSLDYNIEVVYYLAPHQPGGFKHPAGVKGVQYSHPDDAVSSVPGALPVGGSSLEKIQDTNNNKSLIYLFFQQIVSTGIGGNRGGHNVTDHMYIFSKYLKGKKGYVEPRKDKKAAEQRKEKGKNWLLKSK